MGRCQSQSGDRGRGQRKIDRETCKNGDKRIWGKVIVGLGRNV